MNDDTVSLLLNHKHHAERLVAPPSVQASLTSFNESAYGLTITKGDFLIKVYTLLYTCGVVLEMAPWYTELFHFCSSRSFTHSLLLDPESASILSFPFNCC